MKFLIIALCVGCAYASAVDDAHAEAVKNDFEIFPDGGYQWSYENSNGIAGSAQAAFKDAALVVQGSNSYVSDGEQYSITYTADENGYHPQGPHIPTPPPTPETILRALDYIHNHPYKEEQRSKREVGVLPQIWPPGVVRSTV